MVTGEDLIFGRLPSLATSINFCLASGDLTKVSRIGQALFAVGPANIDSVSFANGQITVRWSGMSGLAYRISFANSLLGPWNDIPQVITSETDSFEFVDDGSLTGGLLSPRFYRVNLLPMP